MTLLHREIQANLSSLGERLAIDGDELGQLSYSDLARVVAVYGAAVADASAVAILSNKRPETYCAVLLCFLLGKKFVPLNPKLPQARLSTIIALSGADIILCDPSTEQAASALKPSAILLELFKLGDAGAECADPPHIPIDPEAFCYHLFTSGSTGEPKGVPIPYRALDHYVHAVQSFVAYPHAPRTSQCFDLSFDVSMHDIFVTLALGGTIVPASQMNLMMPHSFIVKQRIDVWFSVPMIAMIAAREAKGKNVQGTVKVAQFAGEPLPRDFMLNFEPFMSEGGKIYNLYGPTEATITVTGQVFEGSARNPAIVPLGRSFGGNRIAVLTGAGEVVPVDEGAHGELLLGGPQVFGGYVPAREDHPLFERDGTTWYRSGDLVTLSDGLLTHHGRIDDQVKIRGNRVELGEVEHVFRKKLNCDAACALIARQDNDGELRVAYEKMEDIASLQPLIDTLPDYMVPRRIKRVDRLPINNNGKIDRRAVAALDWS